MSKEYGCENCMKSPKKRPYGSKLGKFWCSRCDAGVVNSASKKRARREGKKECLRQLNYSSE